MRYNFLQEGTFFGRSNEFYQYSTSQFNKHFQAMGILGFKAQCFDLVTLVNSHLDIQVEVGRNACVVWDGVGG